MSDNQEKKAPRAGLELRVVRVRRRLAASVKTGSGVEGSECARTDPTVGGYKPICNLNKTTLC